MKIYTHHEKPTLFVVMFLNYCVFEIEHNCDYYKNKLYETSNYLQWNFKIMFALQRQQSSLGINCVKHRILEQYKHFGTIRPFFSNTIIWGEVVLEIACCVSRACKTIIYKIRVPFNELYCIDLIVHAILDKNLSSLVFCGELPIH